MKKLALAATALTMLITTPGLALANFDQAQNQQLAQNRDRDADYWRDDNRRDNDRRDNDRGNDRRDNDRGRNWKSGDRLPPEYRGKSYYVDDYKRYNLRKPPRNQRWMRVDDRFVLAASSNGVIFEIVMANDGPRYDNRDQRSWRNPPPPPPGRNRDDVWRARYSRSYQLDDDSFYKECRNQPDPAGALIGAIAGGLLGRTVAGRGSRTEGTVVGVVAGGAIGAALTNKVQCEDRSYMYKTYGTAFNSGRPGSRHTWENPNNRHRGEMEIIDYYEDEDNFRCSVFSNTVYIDGRREEARGRACQQPNGSWAIID